MPLNETDNQDNPENLTRDYTFSVELGSFWGNITPEELQSDVNEILDFMNEPDKDKENLD